MSDIFVMMVLRLDCVFFFFFLRFEKKFREKNFRVGVFPKRTLQVQGNLEPALRVKIFRFFDIYFLS
jgi:hypothetical protein